MKEMQGRKVKSKEKKDKYEGKSNTDLAASSLGWGRLGDS
jgi:hypothetical protein